MLPLRSLRAFRSRSTRSFCFLMRRTPLLSLPCKFGGQTRPRKTRATKVPTLVESLKTSLAKASTAPNGAGGIGYKPRVRIVFPEFGFGSVSALPGSDSDRFRRARFRFGSVSSGQVRIRIGFAGPGSDSDRILHHETGFGSIFERPADLLAY